MAAPGTTSARDERIDRPLRSRLWSPIARHPATSAVVALVLAGLAIFVLVYFQPQKLFLDQKVSEAAPAASGDVLAQGSFEGIAHETTGAAQVIGLADGSRVLRFQDLNTSNGPDLHVYLSTAPVGSEEETYAEDFATLGKLKGNVGSQNYELPGDLDLSRFQSVVIWCKRFSVAFGVAPLA